MKESYTEKNKPVILIVDDVPKNLQVLGNLLSQMDCELAIAMNGQQALDTVSRIMPDLILLDVMMPLMDGHEVCRRLKENAITRDIPVIFITARTEPEDIITGFDSGAVDYITKPFIGSELMARVKTHLSLKKTREMLQEEVNTKNKFFSIISHDLRSSFGIVMSFVQLIRENLDEISRNEFYELLDDIGNTSKNTLELLENLLEWARIQTGKIQFTPEKHNLQKLAVNAQQSFREKAVRKQISMSINIDSKIDVHADIHMVMLVFRNLISNALKFTNRYGSVFIDGNHHNGFVRIEVKDTGLGIAPEKMTGLFKTGTKNSTPGTENEQGNGLGLILCKEFIDMHGGKVGVESNPGEGTIVWFTLPVS